MRRDVALKPGTLRKLPRQAGLDRVAVHNGNGVVSSHNPMDLDYRALSNAGLWCIGRLQTDADRARVVEGMAGSGGGAGGASAAQLAGLIKGLEPRWFLVRNVHDREGVRLMMPRHAMSFMKGPMTRGEIRRAVEARGVVAGVR